MVCLRGKSIASRVGYFQSLNGEPVSSFATLVKRETIEKTSHHNCPQKAVSRREAFKAVRYKCYEILD
jgi:hypothetical protein